MDIAVKVNTKKFSELEQGDVFVKKGDKSGIFIAITPLEGFLYPDGDITMYNAYNLVNNTTVSLSKDDMVVDVIDAHLIGRV